MPGPTLNANGPAQAANTLAVAAHPQWNFAAASSENRKTLSIQDFYLAGCGFNVELWEDIKQRRLRVKVTSQSEAKVSALRKYLQTKELVRWHPDRLNRRTGSSGVVNEGNGNHELVVLIRSAIEDLVEACDVRIEELRAR